MFTEITYMCSPEWQHYLFTSLRSLLASGTEFDRVTVYCVGDVPSHWAVLDERIHFRAVPRRTCDCFEGNKTYICASEADRVVYLDTDTLILAPLHEIWRNTDADLLVRPEGWYHQSDWPEDRWKERLAMADVPYIPYLNSGFLIFQHGVHRKIEPLWLNFMHDVIAKKLPDIKTRRKCSDQMALSMAVAAAGISYELMDNRQHAYGWNQDPYEDAYVYHTGSYYYLHLITEVEWQKGLSTLELPVMAQPTLLNPIRRQRVYRLIKFLAKHRVKGLLQSVGMFSVAKATLNAMRRR